MRKLRLYLLCSWLGLAVLAVLWYALGPLHPAFWITAFVGIVWESTWAPDLYAQVQKPREFFATALPKLAVLAYGFVLAALAIWLLTAGQKLGHGLKDHLPVIGAVILGPLVLALVLHQIHVFRALGDQDV
jgi:hypothetical protein